MELKIDKSNWKKVKIIDVFTKKEENDKENAKNRFDRFLKVNHMDAETLHIKRWASQENGEELNPTFYKIFRKGQILFPTRNPHLRRTVLASFDGICGEKTLTLEPNEEFLIPEFIPFLFHSNSFYAHTTVAIVGSTNPHCRWRDVANYEFLLPPKDQQAKLAELLWAMDEVVEKENEALNNLYDTYSTSINQFMIHGNYGDDGEIVKTKCGLLDKRIKTIKLKECLLEKPTYGANASSKPFENGSLRYIRITDIDDEGNLIEEDKVTIDSTEYSQYILKDQDFLFARTGNTVGKTLLYDSQMEESVFAGYLIRFRVNPIVLKPKFLFYFTKSLKYESFKRKMIKIGAQPNINSEEYQSMVLPCFSIEIQQELIDRLDFMKSNIDSLKSKIQSSKALQKSLINQVF